MRQLVVVLGVLATWAAMGSAAVEAQNVARLKTPGEMTTAPTNRRSSRRPRPGLGRNTTKLVTNLKNKVDQARNKMQIVMAKRMETMMQKWKGETMAAMDAKVAKVHADLTRELKKSRDVTKHLARQAMLMQFNEEERVRSDGDSGVKLIRGLAKGPANYYETSHVSKSFCAIHDHSNFVDTVGLGELTVVLNGVEFRTRHNDYKLRQPSTTSTDWHATEPLELPGVPPEVTNKPTIEEQIKEMREWFKAYKNQDYSVRDYRKYFKPVLCYLEGAWTKAEERIDEPFSSDRHFIDAASWFELQEKVRFNAYTGSKNRLENLAFLPTTIIGVNDTTGIPEYAQWNYRIMCAPSTEDIPLKELKRVDDYSFRVPNKKSKEAMHLHRAARFRLWEHDKDKFVTYSKIDRLMSHIPGKDNVPPQNMSQMSFGEGMYDMGHTDQDVPLNTGFYHRFFRFSKTGAMGLKSAARGYNDANLWVAQTSQPRVAPVAMEDCSRVRQEQNGKMKRVKVCQSVNTRFSYAVPLEVVYLTPLQSWNPYDIQTGKDHASVTANGRNGQRTQDKAYDGVSFKTFYITPADFYSSPSRKGKRGRFVKTDAADTTRNAVGVLDRQGALRQVRGAGVRVTTPNIDGVGQVRLRYPIAPVHGEGAPVWKELNAFKHAVALALTGDVAEQKDVHLMMSTTHQEDPGEHYHDVYMKFEDYRQMVERPNSKWTVTSSNDHDHTHEIVIRYNKNLARFEFTLCDGEPKCWDGHPKPLVLLTDVGEDMMPL